MNGTFLVDLVRRRVPQVVGIYLALGWGLLEFSDWATNRFSLSPSIAVVVMVAWLGVFPLVVALAWKFGSVESGTRRRRAAAEPAVAVLPFEDLSPHPGNEFLADGISDEITVALARLPGLRVASRTSAFSYRGSGKDVRTLGRELEVTSVLEGSVQRVDDRLRVHAQLVDVDDGYHRWSESFDRQVEDVFAIEDSIAASVANALELILTPPADAASRTAPSAIGAYEFYLKGRQYFYKTTRQSLLFARDMFERAAALDDGYTLAHVGISNSIALLCMYYPAAGADLSRAEAASRRALDLEPGLAEAHAANALVLYLTHRVPESTEAFERALELDPRSFESHYFFGRARFQEGDFEEASRHFEGACRIREDHEAAFFAGQSFEALKRHDEALDAYSRSAAAAERYLALNPDDARAATFIAVALSRLGRPEEARQRARQAIEVDPGDAGVQYNVACFHAVSGNREEALECLENAVRAGFGNREWLGKDPDLDGLRDDPRFQALLVGRPD